MSPAPRRSDGWVSGALGLFALAFAYGGRAPLVASGALLFAAALAWLARRGAHAPEVDPAPDAAARAGGRELLPPP